jgi:hypothetical protein
MKDSTFDRALTCAHKDKAWLIGGGGRGKRYNLNPNGCWITSPSASPPTTSPSPSPYKGVKVIGGDKVAITEVSWGRVGGDGDTADCKNADTTANGKNLNEISEGEESDLVAEALKHIEDMKSKRRRISR